MLRSTLSASPLTLTIQHFPLHFAYIVWKRMFGRPVFKSFSFLRQSNSKPISLRDLKQLHANLVVSQTISEVHVMNTLLSLYAKRGDLNHARLLFDQMPVKNVVTWTSIISAEVHTGSFKNVFELLKTMLESGERPNQYTLSVIIRACISVGLLDLGMQIHGLMIHLGFDSDEFAGGSLVDMYIKIGNDLDNACCVFQGLLNKDNVTWNVMISGFAQAGHSNEVLRLFSNMWEVNGLKPDDFTLTNLLKCCSLVSEVEQIHCLALKLGLEIDIVVRSSLVDLYGKCGDVSSGVKILKLMERKDSFVWSSIISGYMRNGKGKEAVILFTDMYRKGIRLDEYILSGTLKACIEIEDSDIGIQVHSQTIKNGYSRNCIVASVLILLYAGCHKMAEAEKLFRRIDERDLITWNSMILGYAQIEEGCASSIQVFRELCRNTLLKPDAATLISVLKSCHIKLDLVIGLQIHSVILKSNLSQETPVSNSLIHMYSECGAVNDAFRVFEKTVHKDDISWSSIIGTYQQNGLELEALRLNKQMMANGIHFTTYSLPSSIAACSVLAAVDIGTQFHAFVFKLGFHRDVYIGSSLIDLYAKCGNMEESMKAFRDHKEEINEVTLNAMISGYARHGKAIEAINLFKEMERTNVIPNHVTFLGLLSACSHVGLFEESLYIFKLMIHKYDLEPYPEHYSCLVDVFSRAGRLEEAYEFLKNDSSDCARRTLLSACRNYGNTEIAEMTVKKMIENDPNDHACYVLLSNIYSGEGKWEEALELRQKMVRTGVKKDPGSSWLII